MILGSGALGVRPLSDPIELPPIVIPNPGHNPHLDLGSRIYRVCPGITVLPTLTDSANVVGVVSGEVLGEVVGSAVYRGRFGTLVLTPPEDVIIQFD